MFDRFSAEILYGKYIFPVEILYSNYIFPAEIPS